MGRQHLLGGDGHQGAVVDRFDEPVSQCVERRSQRPDILRFRHMLLRLGDHRAVIDERTSADAARAIIVGMVGLTKLPFASVWPTRSSVNWLALPLTGF
jgi:hypothetical protein